VYQNNSEISIIIKDTGIGIASDQLDAIYDPFVTSKTRGAGLGLSMVYQIIMNHNGEIKIQSELSKGTAVTIRLPIQSIENRRRNNNEQRP
jgi:two-component system sporulation sensor kinase A